MVWVLSKGVFSVLGKSKKIYIPFSPYLRQQAILELSSRGNAVSEAYNHKILEHLDDDRILESLIKGVSLFENQKPFRLTLESVAYTQIDKISVVDWENVFLAQEVLEKNNKNRYDKEIANYENKLKVSSLKLYEEYKKAKKSYNSQLTN